MERRLAAIVALDVVGYSRLMRQSEAATLAALRTHCQELVDREIAKHGGRLVSTSGDGCRSNSRT
jgi:adenylate cyclase